MHLAFLLDEDTEKKLARHLERDGHDVERVVAVDTLGSGTPDADICQYALRTDRIIITHDEGYNYRNTVNRILKRLRDRGLVGTDDGHYRFNGDFDRLHEFAQELTHHRHRRQLESVAPSGTLLWESYDEFLAQTETEIDAEHFHETGLARFAAYDLQFLLTSHRYYFYSAAVDSISLADLCCHTLLIDDDTRHRSYCLLLLRHVDVDAATLRARADKYGLTDTIDALIRYLETDGDVQDDRLPEWDEFQALAADYEVPLPP